MANFERQKPGQRLFMAGMDIVHPPDLLPPNKSPYIQNCRAYIKGGIVGRNLLTNPLVTNVEANSTNSSGTGVNGGGSNEPWTNPAGITSTSAYATVTLGGSNPTRSQLLKVTGFSFSIPSTAIVTGIQFSFMGTEVGGTDPFYQVTPLRNGLAAGESVSLVIQNNVTIEYVAGGNGFLFGNIGGNWTPANINGLTGLGVEIEAFGSVPDNIISLSVNSLVATVYYTLPEPLVLSAPPHSIKRLNDTTPNGPSSGYVLVIGAAGKMYVNASQVGSGFSTNPVSLITFRPNASVQPWTYVGDNSELVTIITQALYNGASVSFDCFGQIKIRSDGTVYKTGVKEPQVAPIVTTSNTNVIVGGNLLATAIPWTNYDGQNPDYDYGEADGPPNPGPTPPIDGTPPFVIDVANATSITITSLTGTATINGNSAATPTTTGPSTGASTNPGHYIMEQGTGTTPPATATVVTGAFTDGDGNVITAGVAPLYIPSVVDVGAVIGVANAITVPYGAQVFQIGINSTGDTFSSNSGSFALQVEVTTNALPNVMSTLGTLIVYYWGDSPTSGPQSAYIWKNPDDPSGSGPTRSISDAVGSTTGNSFIFDTSFGSSASPPLPAGIPGLPGIGSPSLPMAWTVLSPESVASGSNPVFTPAIKGVDGNTAYQNFNFCLYGSIYIPEAGDYTFVLTNHDDIIWGIGGGAKLVSASSTFNGGSTTPTLSTYGQTITVVNGYPLLPRGPYPSGEGGDHAVSTVVVSFAGPGVYPIEIDYDYWYHSGRILLLMASPKPSVSPTIIPPLPANVRQEVQYRYVYRSSATGAQSNPSPESTAQTIPVVANTITSLWSPDPQIDVVDYYRIDSVTSAFTYVATGPNDNLGTVSGTNTSVTDSLLDTELGDQLLNYDNYEPFPSIDLPQKGICSVSGGVITWVNGGAIGGSQTKFNIRWLAGTEILIGSPTSLAYTFIARPYPASFQTNSGYIAGEVILDPAGHYQQVTIAGTSGASTPTFNDSGGTTTSGGVTFQDQGTVFGWNGYVTQINIPGVPDGTNLVYQIAEPILAAQPLPYIWGPTDNINFAYGVGDPLRPGTLYWCQGSNLDSAPDTNQMDVTDPSEPLVNGAITGGLGVVFSIRRAWLILPNFFNATATATGTTGSTWSLQESSIDRGLYMPRCVCVDGGGNIFFRVSDGIHVSARGSASKSITDEDLYPLFAHENEDGGTSIPQPITIAGYTIYPPNDALPQAQRFSIVGAYMYYDYLDATSTPRTLVFDIAAMGWVVDVYSPTVTIHASNDGESIQGVLTGCSDGSIRQLASKGIEVATAVFLTPAFDKGDTRSICQWGDLYIESENP